MPNSSIDLHLHSHYSDGQASPAEIIRYAAEIGLKTISITDHDNLNGWPEGHFIASQVGIDLIPGADNLPDGGVHATKSPEIQARR